MGETDTERLAAIAARVATATPGPWIEESSNCGPPAVWGGEPVERTDRYVYRRTTYVGEREVFKGGCTECGGGGWFNDADAAFIMSGREDIPWLLELVARLQQQVEALQWEAHCRESDAHHDREWSTD